MKTILVIDDGSASAKHAAHFALSMAQQAEASLVLAHVYPLKRPAASRKLQLAGQNIPEYDITEPTQDLSAQLKLVATGAFVPPIDEFDALLDTEAQLISYINKNNIWLVIKGVTKPEPFDTEIKIQSVLNRITCPLMLIPEKYDRQGFKQVIYIADLRYCRLSVLHYLAALARPYKANLLLTHLSAKGLPHIEQNYALSLFNDEISTRINYEQLHFNNTKERDVTRAVDVMVHTMNADLLAVVHHRFHCEELAAESNGISVPVHVTIPVVIFPY